MLQKLFGFDPSTMLVKKEIVGGITTFLTMAYILAVNPSILAAAGMDQGALFTASCVSAIVATLVMAFHAKLPYALAPAMGPNAFFAFTIVCAMGYTWQFALTAVFLEGIIFMILTYTGLRQKVLDAIPYTLRCAITPGIGLFIAFIGLRGAGIIVSSDSTSVTLGNMHDPGVLLAIGGIILTAILLVRKVSFALLIGILVTTVVGLPFGITHFSDVLSAPPSLEPIFWKFEWSKVLSLDMLICVLTFLFMDLFDTIGTLIGVSNRAGMLDEKGNVLRLNEAFMADAVGTTVGAMLGTSTVTTFVESAAGVNAGGRSGLTAFSTAMCFVVALFFAPIFLAIPSQATACALVVVGAMMIQDIHKVKFSDFRKGIPAFICIIMMPLAYSISDGILLGSISYTLINLLSGSIKDVDERDRMTWATYLFTILFVLKYAFL